MSKLKSVWIITDKISCAAELCCGARSFGEQVTIIFSGEKEITADADKALWVGASPCWPALAAGLAEVVKSENPELVMFPTTKNGRLLAGYVAAAMGTSVLTDSFALNVKESVIAKRKVYGGAAIRTEREKGSTAIAIVSAGTFCVESVGKTISAQELKVAQATGMRRTDTKALEVANVNLSSAKRIVGVGRGVQDEMSLDLVRKLAQSVGAEIGCTRPIAEELKLMPRETYIGISGVIVKPDIYFAVGLSGQVQHFAGIEQAGTIVAVNKNEGAPIFKSCDFGIVGDLNKILPELTKLVEDNKA